MSEPLTDRELLARIRSRSQALSRARKLVGKAHQDACDGYVVAPDRFRDDRALLADLLQLLGGSNA